MTSLMHFLKRKNRRRCWTCLEDELIKLEKRRDSLDFVILLGFHFQSWAMKTKIEGISCERVNLEAFIVNSSTQL